MEGELGYGMGADRLPGSLSLRLKGWPGNDTTLRECSTSDLSQTSGGGEINMAVIVTEGLSLVFPNWHSLHTCLYRAASVKGERPSIPAPGDGTITIDQPMSRDSSSFFHR